MTIKGKDYVCAAARPYIVFGLLTSIIISYLGINSVFIMAFTLCWMIEGSPREKWRLARRDTLLLAFFLYFLVQLFTTTKATDAESGWKYLETRLGFIALPAVICTGSFVTNSFVRQTLLMFSILLTIAGIACLGIATVHFAATHDSAVFFYHTLVSPIEHHAVYFSVYIFISIVFLAMEGTRINWLKKRPGLLIAWIFFLSALILLLSSKLVLLFLVLFLIYAAYKLYAKKIKSIYITVSIAVFLLVGATLSVTNNPVKDRFTDLFRGNIVAMNDSNYNAGSSFSGLQFRLLLWRVSLNIVEENHAWLSGVGATNSAKLIRQKLVGMNLYTGSDGKHQGGYLIYDNCHNQFLQELLDSGIIGLLVFLIWCAVFAARVINKRDAMLTWVAVLTFCFFFSESVFERQYGMLLCTFFSLILLYRKPDPT